MKKLFLFVAVLCATVALNAKTITLEPGEDKISAAIEEAEAGDVIELTGDAQNEYTEWNTIRLTKAITIKAAAGATPVVHMPKLCPNGGDFVIDGVEVYGFEDYLFRTETGGEFSVTFKNCTFRDNDSRFYYLSEGQTINAVTVDNCIITNFTASEQPVIYGLGKIKSFEMKNTTVFNCTGPYPIRVYNSDHVLIDHCTIYNVGKQTIRLVENSRETSDVLVSNTVVASASEQTDYAFYIYNGAVKNCVYYNTGSYRSDNATAENLVNADPKFVNAAQGNFNFTSDSPLTGKATDGSNIGDPRWKEAKAEMVFSFIAPAKDEEAINDYTIKFSAVVPEGTATYAIAYSYDGETWKDIVAETAYTNQNEATFATRGLEEGEVTLRGILATEKDTVETICDYTLSIVKDTEAPRAIANFDVNVDGTNATLTWKNPTYEISVGGALLGEENILELAKSFVPNGDEAILGVEDNTLKMTITTSTAWHQTGVEFDVTSFENVQNVAFKIKGDGATQIEVMLIQDGSYWWASSAFVPGTEWETHKISEFKHVDWHDQCPYKTLDGNHVTGVAIEVNNGTVVNGAVFYLDSVMVEGVIAPSKYYAKTVIRRSTEDYPETIADGDSVYEGTAETIVDEIDLTKTYYYAAFAVDDIANVSAPANVFVEGQQVTHTIFNVSVPAGTDACYLVGSMNSWAVDDPIEMTMVDATHYTYQAGTDLTGAEYKYVHGDDWAYVEKKADGGEMSNRVVNAAVMNDEVARWADDDTALQDAKAAKVCVKTISNGQFVILKNNVRYNILGAEF